MRSALLRLLGSSPRGAPRDGKSAFTRVYDALCVAGTPLRGPISTVFGYGVAALCPLRGRRPGRRSFIRTKHQPTAVGNGRRGHSIVSGLLFTMDSATPTCRAVSARQPGRTMCIRSRALGPRVHVLGAMLALLAMPGTAAAQDWPSRPLTLVVPFAAGGPSDVAGRILAQGLSDVLGHQVVVENPSGAGGTVGSLRVAKAPPD